MLCAAGFYITRIVQVDVMRCTILCEGADSDHGKVHVCSCTSLVKLKCDISCRNWDTLCYLKPEISKNRKDICKHEI